MDPTLRRQLEDAGFVPEVADLKLELGLVDAVATKVGEHLTLRQDARTLIVPLPPISLLWTGSRQPPDMSGRYPEAYIPFFATIEQAAADYCVESGRIVIDREFERLYEHLRRRPDGRDAEPIFVVLQAAARLYVALHDVSQAEFEAVARRLARSARTFAMGGPVSRNYWEHALAPFAR
jgi:hypothetical protein